MKNKKVIHAAVNGGMISNFSRLIIEKLNKEGFIIHFFISKYPINGTPQPIIQLKNLGGKIHLFKIPQNFNPFLEFFSIIRMYKLLKKINPSLLHTRGSVMGFVGRISGKIACVPYIIHHQDDLYFREFSNASFRRKIFSIIERYLSKLSDINLFVSREVLKDALENGFSKESCVLVGHDLNPFFYSSMYNNNNTSKWKKIIFNRYKISKKSIVIGCIARLVKFKGIDILIKAIEPVLNEFDSCILIIKGDGILKNNILDIIKKAKLENKVFILDENIPNSEMPDFMKAFDIFILPTKREGFGMVFMEAMSIGLPIIAPKIAPITEFLDEDSAMLVNPENYKNYTNAIRSLVVNAKLREKLSIRAKNRAIQQWGEQKASNKVLKIYKKLLE